MADFLIGCNYHRETEVTRVESHVGSVVPPGFAVLATTTTAADNHKWHKQCFLTRGEMTSRASKPQISLTDISLALGMPYGGLTVPQGEIALTIHNPRSIINLQ